MALTLAEEIEIQKHEARKDRKDKLTKDRRNKHGDTRLAQTDGLKPIHVTGRRKGTIQIDDQEFDPRRIRKLSDLELED